MRVFVRLVALITAILTFVHTSLAPVTSTAAPTLHERPLRTLGPDVARPGRLIVGLKTQNSLRSASAAALPSLLQRRWGAQLDVAALFDRSTFLVETSADLDATAAAIRADRDVAYVEPDYLYYATLSPNDELYSYQYGLPRIAAPQAWDITTGSAGVLVAVIDTGVYAGHPDLRPNVVAGVNFVDGNQNASDDEGHGTHTAGIIAAVGNNGRGVAGVCWQCRILPIKALDETGAGSAVDVSAGIRYAADRGAKVINLSLGGENDSRLLHDAVIYATRRGSLVVVAAGNEALEGNPVEYPAAYAEALAVGATDANDAHAPFSNYGEYLDITAPGVDIGSTFWMDDDPETYALGSGTSEAAPFVAGVAALVWSRNVALSNEQVRQILLSTADDINAPGRDVFTGAGRVNAYRAVQAAAPQQPTPVVPTPGPTEPTPTPVPAPGNDVITFPETGHTLRGEFRRFWEANGGLPVFGYPISEQQVEQTTEGSFIVQYFERNRFEYHPEKPAPYNILLGRLGDTILLQNGTNWWTLPRGQPRPGCQFFAETEHTVCEPFLAYWRTHGLQDGNLDTAGRSLALFGMPISEPRMETNASGDAVMTQWFERARFEDHGGAGVLLGLLGKELAAPGTTVPTPVAPPLPTVPDPTVPQPAPAGSCPDIPPAQNGQAKPSACLPLGSEMVIDAVGFNPGEPVSFWLTAPNGQVSGGQRTITANDDGALLDQRYPTAGLVPGRWYWVFQGIESGRQSIVFFHLYQP